jgi:hypothetical protein
MGKVALKPWSPFALAASTSMGKVVLKPWSPCPLLSVVSFDDQAIEVVVPAFQEEVDRLAWGD